MMTIKNAIAQVRTFDMTLRKTDDEFRVNFKGGTEATAYYTNDITDAVDTARAMRANVTKFGAAQERLQAERRSMRASDWYKKATLQGESR